jgi:hypothetical protein
MLLLLAEVHELVRVSVALLVRLAETLLACILECLLLLRLDLPLAQWHRPHPPVQTLEFQ